MPANNHHGEGDMMHRSSRTRWSLLLKTARSDLELLSGFNFDNVDEFCSDISDPSPQTLIPGIQELLIDMREILSQGQRRWKEEAVVSANARTNTACGKETATVKPDIPVPTILKQLEDTRARMMILNDKIAGLTTKDSAKSHRVLLEEKSMLGPKLDKINKQSEKLDAISHLDFLAVGSATDLFTVIAKLARTNAAQKPALFLFLRNLMAHAIILVLFEDVGNGIDHQKVSLVVDKILGLANLAEDNQELRLHFLSVFNHAAILRLSLPAHLDPKTYGRFKERNKLLVHETNKRGKKALGRDKSETWVLEQLEYWLLSRPWVSNEELMIDSVAIVPITPEEQHMKEDVEEIDKRESTIPLIAAARKENKLEEDLSIDDANSTIIEDDRSSQEEPDHTDDSDDDDDGGIEFPSAPSTELPGVDRKADDKDSVDENEARRLINLFAPSPELSESESVDYEEDSSELHDLTASEREEVLKALASAREHYDEHVTVDKDQSIDVLLQDAKNALKQFGKKSINSKSDDIDVS